MRLSDRRLAMVVTVLLFWTSVAVARLVQIQIVRHDHYTTRAAKQQERILELTPVRGSIRDTRGRILAESIAAQSIYADPQAIVDAAATARKLAAIPELRINARELRKKLEGRGEFSWVARQLDPTVTARVKSLGLAGIYTVEEHRRLYPKGPLAANLLGYVGIDGEGLAGIEHSFDRYARGRAGKVTLLRDARRGMYLVGGEGSNASVDGANVILTIDEVIQFVAERALVKATNEFRALSGSVIVMDPRDGSILAMASVPTFDPNRFRDFPEGSWRNRPVQDLYEPGSTFKVITAAAALEEGIVTPSQVIDCGNGSIEIAKTRIGEHGQAQWDYLTFEDVMANSSNVGTIRVGLELHEKRFYRYIRSFGFGERTGVQLPGESPGILRAPEKWSQLSNAIISIGQEVGTTPLQVITALSAIANGGLLVQPRIVQKVVDHEGHTVATVDVVPPRRVVSEKTAAVLNEILKTVVSRGTGQNAALAEHVVAGKTGTAQKAVRGGYSPDKVVASFAGYVPADRPRLAILVVIDEPKGAQYGGTVAAPVFKEIAEAALHYLNVAPSIPQRTLLVNSRVERNTAEVRAASPMAENPAGVTPDLRGLDGRSAIDRAVRSGFQVGARGEGIVASQRPLPGQIPNADRRMQLVLALPEGMR